MTEAVKPNPRRFKWFSMPVIAGAILGIAAAISTYTGPVAAAARGDEMLSRASALGVVDSDPVVPRIRYDIVNALDAERYQAIFTLQEAGNWSAADKLIAALKADE